MVVRLFYTLPSITYRAKCKKELTDHGIACSTSYDLLLTQVISREDQDIIRLAHSSDYDINYNCFLLDFERFI